MNHNGKEIVETHGLPRPEEEKAHRQIRKKTSEIKINMKPINYQTENELRKHNEINVEIK